MVTAMREAAARLNGIIQSAMDAIISVDERQNIVIFNPAAESMFGCAGADVIGTPLDQFIPVRFRETHRSDIERFGATGVTTRRMNARSQVTGLRANGEEFPLEAAISQVTVGGQKLFTVILRDVSERERSEEVLRESVDRYQRLVDLVPDAIWLEREDSIVFVNRACVHMFGADSSEQLLGRSPLELIHADFRAQAALRRERVMRGTQTTPLMEKKIVRLSGEVRHVEIAETAFPDEGSFAILSVLRDVTERKDAVREVVESREQLRLLSASLQAVREEEKTRIARELHDELGQALTGLKMDLAQLMSALAPEQADAIDHARAMKELLDGTVASVRRIATELRPLMLDDLGLVPTIEWLVNDFSKRAGVAVDLKLPGPDFDVAPELATTLFRVLQESLTNVARHACATGVDVELRDSPAVVELRVQDNGRGITVPPGGHRTLGLLGMRERTTMLGGEFTIHSNPGAGTRVAVSFPRSIAPAGAD